jgi:hypothetical protein
MKGVLRLGQRMYEGDNFHGHMVGSGKYAIMINEAMTNAWLYDIATLGDQPNLEQDFAEDEDAEDEEKDAEISRPKPCHRQDLISSSRWSQGEKEREEAQIPFWR